MPIPIDQELTRSDFYMAKDETTSVLISFDAAYTGCNNGREASSSIICECAFVDTLSGLQGVPENSEALIIGNLGHDFPLPLPVKSRAKIGVQLSRSSPSVMTIFGPRSISRSEPPESRTSASPGSNISATLL